MSQTQLSQSQPPQPGSAWGTQPALGHAPQSAAQVSHVSPAVSSHRPSPQQLWQSAGQVQQSSPNP